MKIMKSIAMALVLAVSAAAGIQAAETLVVKGSTTVFPIAQAAGQAYMKEQHNNVHVTTSATGSSDGIKALLDGTTDIAMSSRDLKPEEKELARRKGMVIEVHRIAIDAIVPVVHPDNPVRNLTLEQLSLIYQGKITRWKDVGGANEDIVVVSRDASSGTYEMWNDKVLRKSRLSERARVMESNGAVVSAVARNKQAVGYIGIGYLRKDIRGVSVEGVSASAETAHSGLYPIARPLYLMTDAGMRETTAGFIRFILRDGGQRIVKAQGFVSVP